LGSKLNGNRIKIGWFRRIYNVLSSATGLGITRNIMDCYSALILRRDCVSQPTPEFHFPPGLQPELDQPADRPAALKQNLMESGGLRTYVGVVPASSAPAAGPALGADPWGRLAAIVHRQKANPNHVGVYEIHLDRKHIDHVLCFHQCRDGASL
jgi:hypothetical protein